MFRVIKLYQVNYFNHEESQEMIDIVDNIKIHQNVKFGE